MNAIKQLGWPHFPCLAHTLQLTVRVGLDLSSVSSLSARCCKLVGHFRHSGKAQASLEEMQRKLNLPVHKLTQEVSTRWNSTYEMYARVVEQKASVSAVRCTSKKATDQELKHSSAELSKLECISKVLKPLAVATEMLCKEATPSVSMALPVIKTLQKKHLVSTDVEAKVVIDLKNAIDNDLQTCMHNLSSDKWLAGGCHIP